MSVSPESRDPGVGRDSCPRDAISRTGPSGSRQPAKKFAMVGIVLRKIALPLLTFIAPLASAWRPLKSWPRVGVHIGPP